MQYFCLLSLLNTAFSPNISVHYHLLLHFHLKRYYHEEEVRVETESGPQMRWWILARPIWRRDHPPKCWDEANRLGPSLAPRGADDWLAWVGISTWWQKQGRGRSGRHHLVAQRQDLAPALRPGLLSSTWMWKDQIHHRDVFSQRLSCGPYPCLWTWAWRSHATRDVSPPLPQGSHDPYYRSRVYLDPPPSPRRLQLGEYLHRNQIESDECLHCEVAQYFLELSKSHAAASNSHVG